MKIYNLSHEQTVMLEILWCFDTAAEIENYKKHFTGPYRQRIDTLIEMCRLQVIDDNLDKSGDLDLAQRMLSATIQKS